MLRQIVEEYPYQHHIDSYQEMVNIQMLDAKIQNKVVEYMENSVHYKTLQQMLEIKAEWLATRTNVRYELCLEG